MKSSFFLWYAIIIYHLCLNTASAQVKFDKIVTNQWAKQPLTIDGNLDDWSDTLKYYDENTRFSYDIQNNNETLFLAIKSISKENLNRILNRGISFSVNTEAKKKAGPTVIFPIIDRSTQTAQAKLISAEQIKLDRHQKLSKITKINVTGFPEIKDGAISLKNSYGISAAAHFDKRDNLIIEIAIPFILLDINSNKEHIACLIEINGIKQTRRPYDPNRNSRSRMYGYPSRDYAYDQNPPVDKQNLATGFWFKSSIAKKILK